jgi:hypothetical protein
MHGIKNFGNLGRREKKTKYKIIPTQPSPTNSITENKKTNERFK